MGKMMRLLFKTKINNALAHSCVFIVWTMLTSTQWNLNSLVGVVFNKALLEINIEVGISVCLFWSAIWTFFFLLTQGVLS